MGIGLGELIGGTVGGVAGYAISGGNPYGALAGFSAGSAMFAEDEEAGGNPQRAEQLRLAKEQKQKWDERYGAVEESLARSMRNMTVESVSALGLQAIEQEYEKAGVAIRQNVTRRHLEGSGIEQELSFQSDLAKAEARAKVRAQAPDKIRDAQSSFLRMGLSSKNQESLESRILGQQATAADQQQQLNDQKRGDLMSAAGEFAGKVPIGDWENPLKDMKFGETQGGNYHRYDGRGADNSAFDDPYDDGVLDNLIGGED